MVGPGIPLSLDEAIKFMIIYMIIVRYMHLDIYIIHILYYPSAV